MNQNDIGTPIALTGVGVIVMGSIYLILKSYCNDRINTMRFGERFARRFEVQEKHLDANALRCLHHVRAMRSLRELKLSSPSGSASATASATASVAASVAASGQPSELTVQEQV